MRTLTAFLILNLCALSPLRADTIFQINATGKQVIVHRDAILVREDSSSLTYKHFELKERRVVKVRLPKGSLPYRVEPSSPEDRQRIVGVWKRFGHKATVTDLTGKTTLVFAAYLDFYPPGGRGSLLESIPPRTTFPVLIEGGGADEFEFTKLQRISFEGDRLRITLRAGAVLEGKFLMPTDQPAEARILGITDAYDPASKEVFDFAMPLGQVKEIQVER